MNRLVLLGLIPLAVAAPAFAQPMDHSSMPGMAMPAAKSAKPAHARPTKRRKPKKAPAVQHHAAHRHAAPAGGAVAGGPAQAMVQPDVHAGHDMSSMPGMTAGPAAAPGADMSGMAGMNKAGDPQGQAAGGHDMSAMEADRPKVEIPKTPPPPPPTGHAADRYFDPSSMAAARAQLRREHGGETLSMAMVSLGEYQARSGGDGGYRWEGQAWLGGDINRLVVKTEGDGSSREGLGAAEAQALYSHAIGPYLDVQAGVRQDFQPSSRTYATVGVQGLLPYWFDVEGALFLSNKGELLARAEGSYDLRLTQRWILQPRAELNFSAQNTPETLTGSGLSNAELGLRLRYEIRREFAPYIGVSYDRRFGKTADYFRAVGERAADTSLVIGIRAFF